MPPKWRKTLEAVLSRRSDANISFSDLCHMLLALGFAERVRGSHHSFDRDGIEELIVIQKAGAKAKPYQVRQIRAIIENHRLAVEEGNR